MTDKITDEREQELSVLLNRLGINANTLTPTQVSNMKYRYARINEPLCTICSRKTKFTHKLIFVYSYTYIHNLSLYIICQIL